MKPAAIRHLKKIDKRLAKLIERVGPMRLDKRVERHPFHALARSIVYQQLAGKAAAAIYARVQALFDGQTFSPEQVLATPVEKLRGAGLSAAKAAAILDLAQKTVEGLVPDAKEIEKLDDEEIIARLSQIRGVGRWTVEMLLIFELRRTDVLPTGDYGVRKGFAKTYRKKDLPTPKQLLAYGEKWRPYRSVAAWYMWRALELE